MRPLKENERRIIDSNRHALTLLIGRNWHIVDMLINSSHFSWPQKDYIESGKTMMDKAGCFLDILRRQSFADFKKLVDALYKDDQPFFAKMLLKGGGKATAI